MQVKAYKSYYGWQAENTIPAPELGPNKAIKINTMKRSSGDLTTNAVVVKIENGMMSFMMFSDYNVTLIRKVKGRATEKAVNEQQAAALEMIATVMEKAKAFYAKNEKEMACA